MIKEKSEEKKDHQNVLGANNKLVANRKKP